MKNRGRLRATLIFTLLLTVGLLAWVVVAGYTPKLGLDLAGGTSVVLTAPEGTEPEVLDKAAEIVRNRTDGLGVAEPEITVEANNIVVQLPGLEDEERALEIIGTTAELGFRPVVAGPFIAPDAAGELEGGDAEQEVEDAESEDSAEIDPAPASEETPAPQSAPFIDGVGDGLAGDQSQGIFKAAAYQQEPPPETTPGDGDATDISDLPPEVQQQLQQQLQQQQGGGGAQGVQQSPPITPREEIAPDKEVTLLDETGVQSFTLGPVALQGNQIQDATAQIQTGGGHSGGGAAGWIVQLSFTGDGDVAYEELTGEAACSPTGDPARRIAIVLDDKVQSAPEVATDVQCGQGISGGGIITMGGDQDQEQAARDLGLVLRFGRLPVELERGNVQTVSPTLGQDSLDAGRIAAAIGLVLVAIVLLTLYRVYGLVIIAGLVEYGILIYVFVSLLGEFAGQTLTLAGLAAVVISIGLNADSAIVYIERVKDELREGRTMHTAVQRGFDRAWKTIVAGDVVTFLAALILYILAVGSVRGFALMLGVSVILDVFIAWFFTRPLVLLSADTWLFRNERLLLWKRTDSDKVDELAASGVAS